MRNGVISLVNWFQSSVSFASYEEYLLIAEDVEDPLDDAEYLDSLDALLADMNTETVPPTEPAPTDEVIASTEPEETVPAENPPIEKKTAAKLEDFPATVGLHMDIGKGDVEAESYNIKNVAGVTAVLNKYAALLPENGKLIFTIGPASHTVNIFVNAQEKIRLYSNWDDVVNGLGADNVYAIDSAEIMGESIQRGEYAAFRTDVHWTPYGAGLVYAAMAQRAGKEPAKYPDDFNITVEEPFRGTYFRDFPSAYYHVEPDQLELLMPKIGAEYRQITGKDEYKVIDFMDMNANPKDRYAIYMSGPGGPWRYVQCDNDQTENCLVITDSFGLTVVPYLTYNYNQVHCYDPRYFDHDIVGYNVAEMIEKYQIQDIYVTVADFHTFASGFLLTYANNHLNME